MRTLRSNNRTRVAGELTIRKLVEGREVWRSEPLPNKVVTSAGFGRNLIARMLAGDSSLGLEIDTASLGDDNTAAADTQTDLLSPLVEDIPITNAAAVDNVVTVDVFIADANLPNDTYEEFGLFIGGRLFARVVISPSYTKATGEDTLFSYTLTLTG